MIETIELPDKEGEYHEYKVSWYLDEGLVYVEWATENEHTITDPKLLALITLELQERHDNPDLEEY